jgi:hypothetical protein
MHGVQADNVSFDQGRGDERVERTQLLVLLLDVARPVDCSRCDLIPTQVMNPMDLFAGCTKSFPIKGTMSMVQMVLRSLCAGWVHSRIAVGSSIEERTLPSSSSTLCIDAGSDPPRSLELREGSMV